MGFELKICKELGSLGTTASEWLSIAETVNSQIRSGEFCERFNKMLREFNGVYAIVGNNMNPFIELDSQAAFASGFDDLQAAYQSGFLQEASKPRHHADAAYEEYLEMVGMKEMKTSYPLLARSFKRLDEFVDKWVTNDAWVVMSIDTVFKTLNRFLFEMVELKKADEEDAFIIYQSAFKAFNPHLELISDKKSQLDAVVI